MSEGKIELYNCDNMELMAKYPDNHFDLAIVDPPYGIDMDGGKIGIDGAGKAKQYTKYDWDKKAPDKAYFEELFRVSKNQIIWGGNYFDLPPCKNYIIWDKEIPEGLSFADCEMAWTSFDKAPKMFRYSAYLDKQDKFHPTQKPVKLYDWIFYKYAKEGQNILDTHIGSGSIRIAAHKAGLNLIGFEIDTEYYEKQEKRFIDFVSQTRLF